MTIRWMAAVFVALLAGAAADDRTDRVRDVAGRARPTIGSALARQDIARPGLVGDPGTPDAAAPVPHALERQMLFFGARTNGTVVRLDHRDRAVFNYLVSYELETDAVVRYPGGLPRMPVRQIAAVARDGDAGLAGVPKTVRALSADESAIVRFKDKRNTLDLDDAVKQLKAQTVPIEAVVTVPNYRAAAKFIEKTRDLFPGMIYADVPGVLGAALGPQLDTEKLIDVPANMRNLDLGVGNRAQFRPRRTADFAQDLGKPRLMDPSDKTSIIQAPCLKG
jgi:hypothetical protein